MAAAEHSESWEALQRRREERMRFEVLRMLYDAVGGVAGMEVSCAACARRLGVWEPEILRVIDFLKRRGFLDYAAPGPVVRLTQAAVDYIEVEAGERRSIRE